MYSAYQHFKIPDGLDLEDKTKVAEWGLTWGNLHIVLVDGTRIDMDPEPQADGNFEIDLSGGEPNETLIMDAAKFGIVYSEDKDEETDKPKPEPEPDKNDEEDEEIALEVKVDEDELSLSVGEFRERMQRNKDDGKWNISDVTRG